MNILRAIALFILDILETIVVAGAVFVVIYLFFMQPHQVVGSSMFPNFKDKEYILTDKISYRFRQPQRGEVIVFKAPDDPNKDFIKRIIGLPGERIKLDQGKVYINGKKLDESYLALNLNTPPGEFMREGQEVSVQDGTLFVMGDNRGNSSDSRSWGLLNKSSIIGRAMLIYWPPPQIGFIPEVRYSY